MPCYKPLRGFRGVTGGISWTPSKAYVDMPMAVPCGRCIGCRLERSRQWAVRMMHEAKMHQDNCFLTLTYDPEHLPSDWSLDKRHFQLFMKRLRKAIAPKRVSFFHCGEYGDTNGRPHYHAVVFGWMPSDRKFFKNGPSGFPVFTSKICDAYWKLGEVFVGNVSFESAGYVARYVVKKVVGQAAPDYYRRCHPETGEIVDMVPEYATMSLNPAIGKSWFEKFSSDVKAYDGVVVAGKLGRPPRYYDKLFGKDAMKEVKRERVFKALEDFANNTDARLEVREECAIARTKAFARDL